MTETHPINRLTARFDSDEIEDEYRAYVFPGNFRNNQVTMSIAIPFFGSYAIMDFLTLPSPQAAIIVRIAVVSLCAVALAMFHSPLLRKHHDTACALMVAAMGSVVAFIVTQDTSLDSSYYVGLIQGGVFLSFLLRLDFAKSLAVLAYFLLAFTVATSASPFKQQAAIQAMILATNLATCAFGIYLLQIYRRRDFEKTKLIARQNEKLNTMLESVQLDNARKVAAMNLLVHFVRTPVHQIVGFADVVSQALNEKSGQTSQECLDSVGIIKTASRELSQNVTRLLTYYRLDEKADEAPALIELDLLLRDYMEHFPPDFKVSATFEKVAIVNRPAIVAAAIAAFLDRYAEDADAAVTVSFSLARSGDSAAITVRDNGAPIEKDEFARKTRPLDKLDHYLSANGSSMSMALRTVARAAQLAGGELTHATENGGNAFRLTFSDFAAVAGEGVAAA